MIKNQANQTIGSQMVTPAGVAFAGSVSVFVDVDAGGQVAGAGSAPALAGNGYYTYAPTQGETNGNLLAFTFTGTGAVPVTVQVATVTPAQQSALSSATGGLSTLVQTIIQDAFREIAVFAPSAAIPPDDNTFALGKLNRLLDWMSADRDLTFSQQFTTFTLTPGHNPHTIGPNSADFTVTTRPTNIRFAQLVLTSSTPNVFIPLHVYNGSPGAKWYSEIPVRNIQTLPWGLYYQRDWPNGLINLWPIPDAAYGLELVTTETFGQFGLTDTIWYPHGYRDFITLSLAKSLVSAYPGAIWAPPSNETLMRLEGVLSNTNVNPPRLETRDTGLPGGRGGSDFNYKSRTWNN